MRFYQANPAAMGYYAEAPEPYGYYGEAPEAYALLRCTTGRLRLLR